MIKYQVPLQFLEDGRLENYFRENNVSIIHLVREAKILKMASEYNNVNQHKFGKEMHSRNENDAATFRDTPKLPWSEQLITNMLKNEKGLLNEKEKIDTLRQISGFLTNTIPNSNEISTDANLFQLHEPLCSDRIEDYENFRKHEKVKESRSAAACDMIELFSKM